jgi:23S rRNA pseudouridine1911/1915/1917 synthase
MSTRSFIVGRREAGRSLLDMLRARLSLAPDAARRILRARQVRVAGKPCLDPQRRLRLGQRIDVLNVHTGHTPPPRRSREDREHGEKGNSPPRPRPSGPAPVVRHADAQVVVVDKPAGLTTMRHAEDVAEFGARARRFLPSTLADLLPGLLGAGRQPVRAVHRLDKETSGLVVFARTVQAERDLGRQFRAHSTERLYLAVVRGRAKAGRFESWLVRDRGDGRRGSSAQPGEGQRAVTHVRVVEELGEYTLVECRLETGRTHQVRIHLGEAGFPLCGERVYDRPRNGPPLPDDSGARRICLHAATLGFDHPASGERVRWVSPLPKDMARLVERLRQARRPS